MRRTVVAVTAALMLSMVPAAPPALAVPFSFSPAVITSGSGSVTEVRHRRKHYRQHNYRRHNYRYPYRYSYRHHYRYPYGYRHNFRYPYHRGVCLRIEGFRICL
jgi:hypothetical protein